MVKLICEYCKKELEPHEKVKGSTIWCYLCSDCRKINPCGSPFCEKSKYLHFH